MRMRLLWMIAKRQSEVRLRLRWQHQRIEETAGEHTALDLAFLPACRCFQREVGMGCVFLFWTNTSTHACSYLDRLLLWGQGKGECARAAKVIASERWWTQR